MIQNTRLGHFFTVAYLAAIVGCQAAAVQNPGAQRMSESAVIPLVVGTYNQKGSEGIYRIFYNSASGELSEPQLLAKAENPSFLAVSERRKLYAVAEVEAGGLVTYAVGTDGELTELSTALTHGASPCYISVSPDGHYLATANYMGGNVSVFRLDEQGVAQPEPQILQHHGRGPNTSRQEAPHAHWVQWDKSQTYLYAVDLGIDAIRVYPFDSRSGKAGNGGTALKLRPGDGPRHLFFHPNLPIAYILNELSNTVIVAERSGDGSLREVQRIDTLPADFAEHSQAAHLYVTADGKTLYASNRGHDSIAAFAIAADGRLRLLEIEPVMGDWPRHFLVLEEAQALVVANQESHNLVVFKVAADGTLSPTGRQVDLPQATFIGRLPLSQTEQ